MPKSSSQKLKQPKEKIMANIALRSVDIPSIHRFGIGFDSILDDLLRTVDRQQSTSYPPYNIIKLGDSKFAIELAVAGFKEGDIVVHVENNQLSITGSKVTELEGPVYLHNGISSRAFVRTFTLAEHVVVTGATVTDGILTINLEQVVPEEKKPKQIPISYSK
jgi:molecular chaperone IbpA